MKKRSILFTLFILSFSFSRAQSAPADSLAIIKTINAYFDGIMQNNLEKVKQAFHPDAHIMSVYPGGYYYNNTASSWGQFTKQGQKPNPDSSFNKILSIDIAGTTAVVKTDLNWARIHYVDFLSLMKIEGDWKIFSKVWYQERK